MKIEVTDQVPSNIKRIVKYAELYEQIKDIPEGKHLKIICEDSKEANLVAVALRGKKYSNMLIIKRGNETWVLREATNGE